LVNGNHVEDIKLAEDPAKHFVVATNDVRVFKNLLTN